MSKQIAVLSSDASKNFNALELYFKDKNVEIIETNAPLKAAESDLCLIDGFKGYLSEEVLSCTKFVIIHYSLLPAFDCENPVKEAFDAGVKVSGVTVCYLREDGTNGKIIAQYPVFVDVMTTFEEFEEEVYCVSQKLLPFVLESILKDQIFSFDMLLKPKNCRGSCDGGCNGCGA